MSSPDSQYIEQQFEQLLLFPPEALTVVVTAHVIRAANGLQIGYVITHGGSQEWLAARIQTIPFEPSWEQRAGALFAKCLRGMAQQVEPFL